MKYKVIIAIVGVLVLGWITAVHMVATARANAPDPKQLCNQEAAQMGQDWDSYKVVHVAGKAVGVTCDFGSPAQMNVYVQYSNS